MASVNQTNKDFENHLQEDNVTIVRHNMNSVKSQANMERQVNIENYNRF